MDFSHSLAASRVFSLLLVAFIAFCIFYNCSRSDDAENENGSSYRMPLEHAFVGDQQCQSCHTKEWDSWKDSHHYLAMAKASDETVLGDFNDARYSKGDDHYRFYREDGRFMVEAPGPDGEQETYEVTYTFGWEPLQQYLVDFGNGKLQALHASWDTEEEYWFSLYPDDVIKPDEWLHWTGGAMNWNTMCADCHSTKLRQNYIAGADSFDTQWSSINVSCEACHGPGQGHVTFMESDESVDASPERIRSDLNLAGNATQAEEINTCAPCHSRRQGLTGNYIHGEEYFDHYEPQLIHPVLYYPDGQILDEVYVYGSFLQSRMFMDGVRCSDCHDPHTARLKANVTDNTLCMQCHEPRYNSPEHHFHQINTEAAQCISCHMPGRYYMVNDFRRDHSFRVPRPDLSETSGAPNTCNDCHSDQSASWAAMAIEEWYGEEREYHYSETLVKANAAKPGAVEDLWQLITDTNQPEIARATAVWFLGQFPERYSDGQSLNALREALNSESPIIRKSAANILDQFPLEIKQEMLVSKLDDPIRTVRLSALRGLAELSPADLGGGNQQLFSAALAEYKEYLDFNQYFPQSQMSSGQLYERQGDIEKAIESYHTALEKDPLFNPARVNLAYLYNSRGQNDQAQELLQVVIEQEPEFGEAYYSLALILAEDGQYQGALDYFKQASELMPENGRVFYNYAIALQTLELRDEAEKVYLQAISLDQHNADFRYGLVTLYMQQTEFAKALEHAKILDEQMPNNEQIQRLLGYINQQMR